MDNESFPSPGDLVEGRYRIVDLVGRGGHGVVYRARQEALDRVVALKMIEPRDSGGQDVDRLRREVFHASGLTHPNTVEVYDYGTTAEGNLYIAMEYLPGLNLGEFIDEYGAMDVPTATDAILQILDGLAEAHHQGIIHRDLKPANIICQRTPGPSRRMQMKVLDFGLSKYIGENDGSVPAISVTQEGRVYGTPHYMAPEQACGGRLRPATDVYTTGLIAHEMVSGVPAFDGDSRRDIMGRQISEPPPPLPEHVRGTPLADFIEKCLEKQPGDRFETAGQARKWLASRRREFENLQAVIDSAERRAIEEADQGSEVSETGPLGQQSPVLSPSRIARRISEMSLIGHEGELEACRDWIDRAGRRGGLLWLTGGPGLGKTRLLRSIDGLLNDRGVYRLTGRFQQSRSTLRTFRRLLAPLVEESSGQSDSLRHLLPDEILGELDRDLGVASEPAGREVGRRTNPMFEGIVGALLAVAETRPLVILLDDVHHAGGMAVGLLRQLLRRIHRTGASLGIVLAGRPQEMKVTPAVRRLHREHASRSEADTEMAFVDLRLEPLGERESEQFLDAIAPLDSALRADIIRHASGNPLYMAQVVRYLVEHDLLKVGEEEQLAPRDPDVDLEQLVPPSLRGLCLRRLRALAERSDEGETALQLLVRMALLGDRMEASLLERLLDAEGVTHGEIIDRQLDRLVELDIVREESVAGEEGWRFADPMLRKAVLDSIDPDGDRGVELHRLAAQTKVRHGGAAGSQQLPGRTHEIAVHLERAGDDDRAVDWYLRSATHLESHAEDARALDDLRAAVRLLSRIDEPTDQQTRRLVDVRLELARIARRAGHFGPAEDTLRAALTEVEILGDRNLRGEAHYHLADTLLQRGDIERARRHFEEGAGAFEAAGITDRALECRLGIGRTLRRDGTNDRAEQHFRDLLAEAEAANLPAIEAAALRALGRSLYAHGRLDEAVDYLERAVERAEPGSEIAVEAAIDWGLTEIFYRSPTDAARRIEEALETKHRSADLLGEARAHLILGMALRRTPQLERADHHASRARRLYEKAGHRWGIAKAVLLEAEVDWSQGDAERAARLARDAHELHRGLEDTHGLALSLTYEALFLNVLGRTEEARELLMRALALGSRSGLELYRSRTLLFLGMVEESENDVDRARMYYEDALDTARRQHNREIQILARISLIKLGLVEGKAAELTEEIADIREEAADYGHMFATVFGVAAEAWVAARIGDEEWLEASMTKLRSFVQRDDSPDLKIPDRLFQIAQMMTRRDDQADSQDSLEAIERLLRELGADGYAHRLSLQLRTISEGEDLE